MRKGIFWGSSRQPSWKLDFQVAGTVLLESNPWRLLMSSFMPVSPTKWLYHLTAPRQWRPCWKIAAILKFQSPASIFLTRYPWRLFMQIFMLVSPNERLYQLSAPQVWAHISIQMYRLVFFIYFIFFHFVSCKHKMSDLSFWKKEGTFLSLLNYLFWAM